MAFFLALSASTITILPYRIASFNTDSSGNNIEVDLIILITIDFKIYSVNQGQIKFKCSQHFEMTGLLHWDQIFSTQKREYFKFRPNQTLRSPKSKNKLGS